MTENYPPDGAVPKIRVFLSDGRGSAGTWNQRLGAGDRYWPAPPTPKGDFIESLYGSAGGMFLECFHAKHPQLSGSAECGDLFDHDSYAVRLTPAEAVAWLQRHNLGVPDDLKAALQGVDDPQEPADKPVVEKPAVLLTSWRDILIALHLRNNSEDRQKVKGLNETCDGPIRKRGQGKQPFVGRATLLEWWNHLEAMAETGNLSKDSKLTVALQHDYGQSGTAVPEISGGVEKRRKDRRA